MIAQRGRVAMGIFTGSSMIREAGTRSEANTARFIGNGVSGLRRAGYSLDHWARYQQSFRNASRFTRGIYNAGWNHIMTGARNNSVWLNPQNLRWTQGVGRHFSYVPHALHGLVRAGMGIGYANILGDSLGLSGTLRNHLACN